VRKGKTTLVNLFAPSRPQQGLTNVSFYPSSLVYGIAGWEILRHWFSKDKNPAIHKNSCNSSFLTLPNPSSAFAFSRLSPAAFSEVFSETCPFLEEWLPT